jgi:hypothetical protein
MKIRTTYDPPPISMWEQFAWSAVDDDSYDYDGPIGWGSTEEEAIGNLMEKLAEQNYLEHQEWLRTVATPDNSNRVVKLIKDICGKEEDTDA